MDTHTCNYGDTFIPYVIDGASYVVGDQEFDDLGKLEVDAYFGVLLSIGSSEDSPVRAGGCIGFNPRNPESRARLEGLIKALRDGLAHADAVSARFLPDSESDAS